jgi:hypothetical protein
MLKTHATLRQFIYRRFNVLDREIQYRKSCRRMVWFRINQYPCPASRKMPVFLNMRIPPRISIPDAEREEKERARSGRALQP